MTKFGKDGILDRLMQLDDDLLSLYPDRDAFDLIIVGGGALILRDLSPEKTLTLDIDVLEAEIEVAELFSRYDINSNVDTFKYSFPTNYVDRLEAIPFMGSMLRIYTLSNEDLAITKLLAWRDQDQSDLRGMVKRRNIDFYKLRQIVNDITELQINLDCETWREFNNRLCQLESWAAV